MSKINPPKSVRTGFSNSVPWKKKEIRKSNHLDMIYHAEKLHKGGDKDFIFKRVGGRRLQLFKKFYFNRYGIQI